MEGAPFRLNDAQEWAYINILFSLTLIQAAKSVKKVEVESNAKKTDTETKPASSSDVDSKKKNNTGVVCGFSCLPFNCFYSSYN